VEDQSWHQKEVRSAEKCKLVDGQRSGQLQAMNESSIWQGGEQLKVDI
jgi:hypothetical protein